MKKPPPNFLCTDASLAAGEAQVGTAVSAAVWLLLEYGAPWQPKAPTDNKFSPDVQAWLDEQLATLPNGRLQFIKQDHTSLTPPFHFYVVVADETAPRLYHYTLNSYAALLNIDLAAIVDNRPEAAFYQTTQPLIAVCTHGRRDRCCALFGLPLYRMLVAMLGDNVWQTTHAGGHRFAGTLFTFPDATSYGRLTPADIQPFLADWQQDSLYVNKLRGRTVYDSITQIADYYLRCETGKQSLTAFRHHNTLADGVQWRVQFVETAVGTLHTIILQETAEPLRIYASSGSYKIKDVSQYDFVAHLITAS